MSAVGDDETSFGHQTKRRFVDDFAVSYFNGSVKPNLAEKNMMTGKDIEYLMDGQQFEKIGRQEIWAYSSAVGTGYQYRVTYRDKRFSDLGRLLAMYSGVTAISEEDRPDVERKLYEMIIQLLQEKRLPPNFKIQSTREPRIDELSAMVNQLTKSMEELQKRVKALEDQPRALDPASSASSPQIVP